MERISWRRKQLLPVLTVRGAGFHCCDLNCRSRTHCAVLFHGRSGGTWSRILDWPVAVDICRCLPRFRLGPVHSIDDSDHVSAALSRAACVCSSRGPGKLATRADPALRLFLLLLAVAAVMVNRTVTCATCCITAIPYMGTVILLPIPVTLGAFSLLFLRQFGLDYDVWADFMPPEFLVVLMPPPALSGSEAG